MGIEANPIGQNRRYCAFRSDWSQMESSSMYQPPCPELKDNSLSRGFGATYKSWIALELANWPTVTGNFSPKSGLHLN